MTLDQLAKLGTAISGLTTTFGFLLAWRGFNGWRLQKRAEHAAEAARKAYSALTRACDALERYAQRPHIPGPELLANRERTASVHNLIDERRRELAPVFADLREAEEAAALYLGAPYDSLFSWATALEGIVRTNAVMWALHVSDGKEEEAKAAFDAAFGADVQKGISDLRRQAKHAMRPVARYRESPLVHWLLFSRIDALIGGLARKRNRTFSAEPAADRKERQAA